MPARLNYYALLPKEMNTLMTLEKLLSQSGLPLNLLELLKLRASILNGCAFCVRYHMRRLRQQGETEERIDLVSAWREATCYTARERAAFEFTEQLTLISHQQEIGDELLEELRDHFSEHEIAALALSNGLINVWNRIAIAFKAEHTSIDQLLRSTKAEDEAFALQHA